MAYDTFDISIFFKKTADYDVHSENIFKRHSSQLIYTGPISKREEEVP